METAPGRGERVKGGRSGSHNQKPPSSNCKQKPACGNCKQKPACGNCKQKPACGSYEQFLHVETVSRNELAAKCKQKPASGNCKQKPASGSCKLRPACSSNKQTNQWKLQIFRKKTHQCPLAHRQGHKMEKLMKLD